jgi:carbamoylphosphate synthase large subunit
MRNLVGKAVFSEEMNEDNISIHIKEQVCEDWKWIKLDRDRVQWPALVRTVFSSGCNTNKLICQLVS